ncbi:MAG TPA: T9SS type A sorting domain-containing protein, partial [bacterium]|nr:T9SS type A sorting domain-containing protein [bacterium]
MSHVTLRATVAAVATHLLLLALSASAQSWSQVPTPNPGPDRNQVRGISALSPTEVWAVGRYMLNPWGTTPSLNHNLVMRYDGASWTLYPVTNHGLTYNCLYDVEALSSTNVWAVGDFDAGGGNAQAQLLHYDGSTWSSEVVNFPHPGSPWPGSTTFEAIDAISPTDIWAVGTRSVPNIDSAFAYHFDGSSWSTIPVPAVGNRRNNLRDVHGLAANDVWTVGSYRNGPYGGQFKPMALHWDGTDWTSFPLPAATHSMIAELECVRMVAPNDVWAAGTILTGGTLLLHFDGSSWSQVPGPVGGGDFAVLTPNDIYSVGAIITHWDGASWSVVDSLQSFPSASLTSASVLPDGEIWAGGVSRDLAPNGDDYTLVYRSHSPLPRLAVTASAPSVPAGTPVQLLAQPPTPGTYTYRWTAATPNAFSNPGIANPTVSPTAPTAYAVHVTDQAGNSLQGVVRVGIGTPTGLSATASPLQLGASPNPFSDQLAITLASARPLQAHLTLTDALGRLVARQSVALPPGQHQLPLSLPAPSIPPGTYLLTLHTPDGISHL